MPLLQNNRPSGGVFVYKVFNALAHELQKAFIEAVLNSQSIIIEISSSHFIHQFMNLLWIKPYIIFIIIHLQPVLGVVHSTINVSTNTQVLPRSAMQHCPFFFTNTFLLLRSRCAMAGLPCVPKISTCKCARPLAMDSAIRRQLDASRVLS